MESGKNAAPYPDFMHQPQAEPAKPESGIERESSMIDNSVTTNFKAEALTDQALRLKAPSIFAGAPMAGLSQRYVFVPTTEILQGLREKDWVPVDVEEQRVRTTSRLGFQKHLIRFRRAEQMQTLDEWNAELVLTNSHDAACAYVMRVGIFRRLCSNGLVVSDDTFEAIRFTHARLKPGDVVEASYRVLEYVPKLGALIDRFRKCVLDESQGVAFAEQALLLRYHSLEQAPVEPQTLLTPRRHEDQATDLWTTLNRVQENLVRGGLSDRRRNRSGRLRSLRALRGLDSKVILNKGLWNLAETTANHWN